MHILQAIGHLCHDEPRETSKLKSEQEGILFGNGAAGDTNTFAQNLMGPPLDGSGPEQQLLGNMSSDLNMGLPSGSVGQSMPPLPQTTEPLSEPPSFDDQAHSFMNYGNWGLRNQGDVNTLYPHYMFNAPDIGSEYSALNNFLNTSLLDEGSLFPVDEVQYASEQPLGNQLQTSDNGNNEGPAEVRQVSQAEDSAQPYPALRGSISRPKSTKPPDKEDEKFYMNIADPSGNEKPEERMKRLLEAKIAAGLLRPFNYIQGYARLNAYLENHMQPALRQRMMRQIDKFRPKFRDKMKFLTDRELTMVEMWFERTLMEYDRVFASMAIPACCWRRTGEIFRGNKEMAELIHVPVDKLRDVRTS
ncbi:uncharacterized protein KY384_004405 [Bacidia gigantensis]|uniref:uncharacterized protein n=1 Tax=Bacidia gigantensis TaxID=2732470 RepID=UPI001D049C04|nr:uncharacterized protein KY384_004405 [Bacidia gigantensis]KAG8531048.1 hypothetical protein KY384_004405 [Bacidia gigantensis]